MLMLSHEGIKEIHNVNVALTCSMSVIKGRHKSYDTIKDAITLKKNTITKDTYLHRSRLW